MEMPGLKCCSVHPDYAEALGRFFLRLIEAGVDRFFHPHQFTKEEAAFRCGYHGKDIYSLLIESDEVVGYGMLRGWDEGFETPSLGIAIDPVAQGRGLGRYMMEFLHRAAMERGASQIMLKVYPDNLQAVSLYKTLGYQFVAEQDGQLLGILEFQSQSQTA